MIPQAPFTKVKTINVPATILEKPFGSVKSGTKHQAIKMQLIDVSRRPRNKEKKPAFP